MMDSFQHNQGVSDEIRSSYITQHNTTQHTINSIPKTIAHNPTEDPTEKQQQYFILEIKSKINSDSSNSL